MKRFSKQARLLAGLLALGLAGCGGGSATLYLSGTVYGASKAGIVISNKSNGDSVTLVAGQTSFTMNKLLKNDEFFDIEVTSTPSGVTCVATNNKGHTGAYSISSVTITCTTESHKLGGVINGTKDAITGLVLLNGSDKLTVDTSTMSSTDTSLAFTLPTKVADGAAYGLTIFAQPAGHTCVVNNGAGTMADADITPLVVTCN